MGRQTNGHIYIYIYIYIKANSHLVPAKYTKNCSCQQPGTKQFTQVRLFCSPIQFRTYPLYFQQKLFGFARVPLQWLYCWVETFMRDNIHVYYFSWCCNTPNLQNSRNNIQNQMCIISVNGEWVTPWTKSLSLTRNTHSDSQESFHLLKNLCPQKTACHWTLPWARWIKSTTP